jgi:2-C-methyl-D-erythritol 2,4-cyclodiphosphate synthase
MMRIGQGYDVHKFCENRPLILGGETIPYNRGLLGHSDADVLTHALMDAMLGAAALRDIGYHFPDTDPTYKGANSLDLLKRVCDLLHASYFTLINVDITVIAEKPKLSPYIEMMQKNLQEVLQIPINCINIKATTTEGLGFTGRNEGIAAMAICLVEEIPK